MIHRRLPSSECFRNKPRQEKFKFLVGRMLSVCVHKGWRFPLDFNLWWFQINATKFSFSVCECSEKRPAWNSVRPWLDCLFFVLVYILPFISCFSFNYFFKKIWDCHSLRVSWWMKQRYFIHKFYREYRNFFLFSTIQVGSHPSHGTPLSPSSILSAGSFEWGYVPEAGQPSTADLIASQSQDYIDERLQEFQATIVQLQSKMDISSFLF